MTEILKRQYGDTEQECAKAYESTFRAIFKPGDSLYLLPIYYAGATA